MLEFFRKYNKKLLAVFASFVLVIWLGGDALVSMVGSDPSQFTVGKSRFGSVTGLDQNQAQFVQKLLEQVGLNWRFPVGEVSGEPLDVNHWILLQREAKELDLSIGAGSILSLQPFSSIKSTVDMMAAQEDLQPAVFYHAFAQFAAIQEAVQLLTAATVPSLAEVRVVGKQTLDKANIEAVIIPAKAYVEKTEEFPEDQIAAQFDNYKAKEKGEGISFGYVVPHQIQMEYIEIDQGSIAQNLRVDEAAIEKLARKFFKESPQDPTFMRPIDERIGKVAPVKAASSESGDATEADSTASAEPAKGEAGSAEGAASEAGTEKPSEDPEPKDSKGKGAKGEKDKKNRDGTKGGGENSADGEEPSGGSEKTGGPRAGDEPVMLPSLGDAAAQEGGEAAAQAGTSAAAQETGDQKTAEQDRADEETRTSDASEEDGKEQTQEADPSKRPYYGPIAPMYYETWEDVSEKAIEKIRNDKAQEAAGKIADWLSRQLEDPWIGVLRNEEGFKIAPENVKVEGYLQALIERVPAKIAYPEAVTVKRTGMLKPRNFAEPEVESLANATDSRGGVRPAQVGFRVEGLVTPPESRAANDGPYLSLYQTAPYVFLNSITKKTYLVRVVDRIKSHVPEKVEEMRQEVIEDLRLLAGLKRAESYADDIVKAVHEGGSMEEAYKKMGDTTEIRKKAVYYLDKKTTFPLMHLFFTRYGITEEPPRPFISGGVGYIPAEVGEKIFALQTQDIGCERYVLEAEPAVLAVHWLELQPGDQKAFQDFVKSNFQLMTNTRAETVARQWADPKAIEARTRFAYQTK